MLPTLDSTAQAHERLFVRKDKGYNTTSLKQVNSPIFLELLTDTEENNEKQQL